MCTERPQRPRSGLILNALTNLRVDGENLLRGDHSDAQPAIRYQEASGEVGNVTQFGCCLENKLCISGCIRDGLAARLTVEIDTPSFFAMLDCVILGLFAIYKS